MMKSKKSSAVGIGGMEAIVAQDNVIEASHGASMEDFSMDERAVTAEGADACQGELTIEDGSMSNGTIDADGAQSHGTERVSDTQGAQLVGGNGSMVSGGIAGAEVQLGAAEEVGNVTSTAQNKRKTKRGKKGGKTPNQKDAIKRGGNEAKAGSKTGGST